MKIKENPNSDLEILYKKPTQLRYRNETCARRSTNTNANTNKLRCDSLIGYMTHSLLILIQNYLFNYFCVYNLFYVSSLGEYCV